MTTYRARCGATIVRDVTPGPFASVRERLADYIEAQNPGPINGNVNAASAFRLAANRVRLWQEEGTYELRVLEVVLEQPVVRAVGVRGAGSAHQFVKLPGDRRYRIEVDPTATDPDELTLELEAE